MTIDTTDIPYKDVENLREHITTDTPHILDCAVECWNEYKQYYDPNENVILLGPATTEPKEGIIMIDCSCGKHFTDHTNAIEHIITANSTTTEQGNSQETTQDTLDTQTDTSEQNKE